MDSILIIYIPDEGVDTFFRRENIMEDIFALTHFSTVCRGLLVDANQNIFLGGVTNNPSFMGQV